SPPDVFHQTIVYLCLRSNHHGAAGELTVVEGDKKATAVIELFLSFDPGRKGTPVESGQREEDGDEISELAPTAEAARAKSRYVGGKPHTEQIDVIELTAPMPHAHNIHSSALPSKKPLGCGIKAPVGEITQEGVTGAERQET